MVRHLIGASLLVAALGPLGACGGGNGAPQHPAATVATTTTAAPGLANPASVYCQSRGGQVEIVSSPGGQEGICVLPDGTRIDEWDFYRANHPAPTSTSTSPAP